MPAPVAPRAYGFLGGSFDPIQKGHIALALAALRERNLARVYLVPAACSPFKKKGPRAAPAERVAMIRAAIRGRSGLFIGRWELDQPGPSFTYRTLRRLRKKDPHRRWELIVGEDAWRGFRRWRRWREILAHVPVIVGKRRSSSADGPTSPVFLTARLPAVSSTEIRSALGRGRSVRRWVDPAVNRYIKKKGLYL